MVGLWVCGWEMSYWLQSVIEVAVLLGGRWVKRGWGLGKREVRVRG